MSSSMHRITSTILALALAGTIAAQAPLFAELGEALPDGMGQLIAAADYEGDGDTDLVTTSGVFLNSLGFFTAGPVIPPVAPPAFLPLTGVISVAVADFNGDGLVDVLAGPHGGSVPGMILFLGPPPGGAAFIASPVVLGGVTVLSTFAAADFDGDTDIDVIAASNSGGTPQWELLLNDGSGIFSLAPASQWPFGPIAASWIGAGDFDGDGAIDVFATSQTNAVWRRQVAGAFLPTQTLASTLIADRGAVGDFNGDGTDDVFVVGVSGNEAVHLGSAAGLTSGASSFGGILGPPPLAADVDGDGDAEILRSVVGVSGGSSGSLFYRLGLPGGLGPATLIGPVSFGFGNPRPFHGLAVLDVDGDGDNDVALVPGAETSALLINGGSSGFAPAPKFVPPGFTRLFAPPRDVDGDGDADLLRASISGVVTLTTHRNNGRGDISGPAVAAGSYAAPYLARAEWADLDLDGDSDLWVGSFGSPAATANDTALVNDGTGVFSVGATVSGAGPTGALAFGDFDGDLDVDVIIGRGATGTFPPIYHQPLLFHATPSPPGLAYAGPTPFGVAEFITDIKVYDAEPDGDLDLLVGTVGLGGTPGPARLYLNNGSGSFLPLALFPGSAASTVETGDLNGDGFVDVVLGGQTWLSTGAAYVLIGTHAAPIGRISLADLDLDGDLDLVDAAGRWYPGLGAGTFAAPIPFVSYAPSFAGQMKAAPMDFDADGDLDLAGPGQFTIYWNMTRQAGRTSLVSQGALASLAVFGPPMASWFLAASGPGALPQPAPPLGTLFLDIPTLVIVTGGVLPAVGRSDVFGFVPAAPGLAGSTLSWQALVGVGLTNSFDTVVLP